MRLISCYIENFGGMQKFSYDFNEGLNIILEANGWGKTTLATFLKAMFYGLERTTKRSLDENERKKYEPWNGGAYGGNLVFEADGSVFRLERFFGIKDKEDDFALYDLNTGLKSDAYTEKIGEELFGIDREAFEQSIFMKQGMYAISMTDSVTTKMSGLMASGDDVDCYEKACSRIENEMKIYKKIGNKGRIPEVTEEITDLNRKIADGRQVATAVAEWNEKEAQCRSEMEDFRVQKEELRQQMRKAGELAGLQEKRKHYNTLVAEKEELGKHLELLESFFQSGVPTDEELENYRNKMFLYKHSKEDAPLEDKDFRYPNLVMILKKNPMTEEELDACEQKWNDVKVKENLLDKKKVQIEAMNLREDEQKETLEKEIDATKKKVNVAIIVAIVSFVAALVCYFVIGEVYSFIAMGIFALAGILAVVFGMQKKKLLKESCHENKEILRLEEECKELKQTITNMQKAVFMYLQSFPVSSEDEIPACINKIRIALMELKTADERKERQQFFAEQQKREKETLREEIVLFYRRFYKDAYEADEILLKEIEQKKTEYVHLRNQYASKCSQIEQTEYVDEISMEKMLSMEELQERERILEEKIDEQEIYLQQVLQRLSRYGEIMEECEKMEMEKHDLEELLADYSAKYKLLEKTLKYLKTAQNEFSSRYLKKMNEGFAKYTQLFREGALKQSVLDIKLAVKSEESGVKREIGYYSKGLREMMELCARFALIEALFEKEQPFVVLDDPFVNLDITSMEGAKKVLAQIAEHYQLIYFTCHPSRQ